MDFVRVEPKTLRNGTIEVMPSFIVKTSKDLLARGRSFYAVWDEEAGMWSTDEMDVARLVDEELTSFANTLSNYPGHVQIKYLSNFSSKAWLDYKKYISSLPDSKKELDSTLTFSNTEVKKSDYVSKRLPYPLEPGDYSAWDEIIGTLYDPEERQKIEWAIGAIVSGDSKRIQKFLVLYGDAGTGKSTILNIIQKLFAGYYTTFEAKALASSSNAFSTEVFRSNPLVAIQHDGDLSKIEDNSKLNSIISHEEMVMNEKYKAGYTARLNCFLFMATNRPVKITDAKSGIIRRLIDVHPSGRKLPASRYYSLMNQIDFQLGAIASRCLEVYRELGKNYYDPYRPFEMMYQTDAFFNFVEDNFDTFKEQDGCTLKQAWAMYKQYCDEANMGMYLPMYKFREELKNYFKDFYDRANVAGQMVRSYFSGFITTKFTKLTPKKPEVFKQDIVLECTESIFDKECSSFPAQYATANEIPMSKWDEVTTTLADIDTSKIHYVKIPQNHIVIDFDLKDEEGKKSAELNLHAASLWPDTYAEFSKGGAGVHLHYIYEGDISKLSRVYSEGIEIKVFNGNSSLRRKLSYCNNRPIAHINSGLPLKGEKKVINTGAVRSERLLREKIKQNLNREVHVNTRPSIDFIYKILEDAYNSGLKYDVTDMRPKILQFAANSTNQAKYCIKRVDEMKFKSDEPSKAGEDIPGAELVFYDIEVFPNLFLVNWKVRGEGKPCVRMINPEPSEIEELFKYRLVGFNCRRYDNHVLYARYLGYSLAEVYDLSQRIINGSKNCFFGEAYNLSYTDVYDFCAKKQSLKKWEIELGLHHQELGLPWDQPVPEDRWIEVAEYCDNDVFATEAVFEANQADFVARQILAQLSGLSVNDTTNSHTKRIIFGGERKPQGQFMYWDLGKPVEKIPEEMEQYLLNNTPLSLSFKTPYIEFYNSPDEAPNSVLPYFPGYTFDHGKSLYRGEDPKEGGYVYAEPGIHHNVALLDIASMHPSSLEDMWMFGPYTQRFSDIKQARILIKHKQFDEAKGLFEGRLSQYLDDPEMADALSYALKIAINSVYGLTSASFENECRDPRNIDNIVAKRGALFMIDLKHEVQKRGFTVAHIKTDSIKIPNATKEIIDFVMEFGRYYGYIFEHEATYEKMCLVNNAVYVAKVWSGKHAGEWVATGAQFQVPYVFKTLFSKEPIEFEDLCETKSVSTAMYLDMNEDLMNDSELKATEKRLLKEMQKEAKEGGYDEKSVYPHSSRYYELEREWQAVSAELESPNYHDYHFVGKAGQFSPIKPGCGGGLLMREKDGKYDSVTGAKDYRWLESEVVKTLGKEDDVDRSFYRQLVDEAIDAIAEYGDAEAFIGDMPNVPPWCIIEDCSSCNERDKCDGLAPVLTENWKN